jgi:hypothetical protein
LDPTLVRDLAVGDTIPDGPPGTAWYNVAHVDAPHTLVLHSTTHLPAGWRDRHRAGIDWTWTFHLIARPRERTRLHVRVRGRTVPWWLTAAYHAAVVPADLVMAVGMLRGIRERAQFATLHHLVRGGERDDPGPAQRVREDEESDQRTDVEVTAGHDAPPFIFMITWTARPGIGRRSPSGRRQAAKGPGRGAIRLWAGGSASDELE